MPLRTTAGYMLGLVFLIIGSSLAVVQIARAQSSGSSSPQTPQTQGAVSTGGAHAAVLDSEKRPITAGGFVDGGPIIFQDIAEKAGLSKWHHVTGTPEKTFNLETDRSGSALLDDDNDACLDI